MTQHLQPLAQLVLVFRTIIRGLFKRETFARRCYTGSRFVAVVFFIEVKFIERKLRQCNHTAQWHFVGLQACATITSI